MSTKKQHYVGRELTVQRRKDVLRPHPEGEGGWSWTTVRESV